MSKTEPTLKNKFVISLTLHVELNADQCGLPDGHLFATDADVAANIASELDVGHFIRNWGLENDCDVRVGTYKVRF